MRRVRRRRPAGGGGGELAHLHGGGDADVARSVGVALKGRVVHLQQISARIREGHWHCGSFRRPVSALGRATQRDAPQGAGRVVGHDWHDPTAHFHPAAMAGSVIFARFGRGALRALVQANLLMGYSGRGDGLAQRCNARRASQSLAGAAGPPGAQKLQAPGPDCTTCRVPAPCPPCSIEPT